MAVLILLCAASTATAQAKLEPLPEPLPPPEIAGPDEPAVRIPVQESDKVEEIRQGGRVVMLKVTPPGGKPYYLVDNGLARGTLDDGVRFPMWPVYLFD